MTFLFSGIGLHAHLEYCCGVLEGIDLFDVVVVEVDECCGDKKSDDCGSSAEWFSVPEPMEFQAPLVLELGDVPSFELQALYELDPQEQAELPDGTILDLQWDTGPPPHPLLQTFLI